MAPWLHTLAQAGSTLAAQEGDQGGGQALAGLGGEPDNILGALTSHAAMMDERACGLMTKRRSRGDGGLHWDEKRQRWIATANLGFDPSGKRIVKRGSGKTKTEAKNKLKEVLRDHENGLAIAPSNCTVKDAVTDWLTYGLAGLDPRTVETKTLLSQKHVTRRTQTPRPQRGGRGPLAGCQGEDAQYAHAPGDPLVPEPCCQTGHGSGQGEAERRRAVLGAPGASGAPF